MKFNMINHLRDPYYTEKTIGTSFAKLGTSEKSDVPISPHLGRDILEMETKPLRAKVDLPVNYMTEGGIFQDTDGCRLGQKMTSIFDQYYNNEVNIDAIKDVMNKTINIIGQYYVDCGYKKEDIISDIIEDVYERARYCNIASAGQQSQKDGKKYAMMYDIDGKSDDWTYYDSKYYYISESMKLSIQTIAKEIGKAHGITELNLPTEYDPATQPELYKMFNSYNAHINFQMCDNHCNGRIIDENLAPPEGFRFFYKGNTSGINVYNESLAPSSKRENALFDSVLHVWYQGIRFTGRIPTYSIDYSKKAHPEVNMYDAVAKVQSIPKEISRFMKNCIFFSPYFAWKCAR